MSQPPDPALPMPPPPLIALAPDSSADEGRDLVNQWLREHNWAVNPGFMEQLRQPEHQARPLVLLATDAATRAVVGGLLAETQLAWLRVSVMAVHPGHRSRGIGAALLAEAERHALARGCRHAYADTMEYQAPRFYLARGFTVAGEIPDWDSRGHRKFYLVKSLAPVSDPNPVTPAPATIREHLRKKLFKARLLAFTFGLLFVATGICERAAGQRPPPQPPANTPLIFLVFIFLLAFLGTIFYMLACIICPRCKAPLGQTLGALEKPGFCPDCGLSLNAPAEN